MGLRPWELYRYSVDEFLSAYSGMVKKRGRELKELWQHARISTYYMVSPHLPKNLRHKGPFDIIPDIYEKPKDRTELLDWYKNRKDRLIKLGLDSASRN